MAVVTIDAKAELAQIQASLDAEAAAERPPAPATEKKAEEPAPKEAGAADKQTEDPDDVEGEDGLTPRQKREFTQAMQRTIGKKHRERREAEEFAAAQYNERKLAEQRADAAERALADLKTKALTQTETQPDPEAGKPTRDKFETDQAYWDAYVDWRADRKARDQVQKFKDDAAREKMERDQAALLETARTRIGRAIELVPDFAEVTGAADIEVPPIVAGYMQKSEMFAELGYHLAKPENRAILDKLAKMPPDEQLVTIGKIEGRLKPFGSSDLKATSGVMPSTTARSSEQPATNGAASSDEAGIAPSRARSSAPVITPLNGASGAAVTKEPSEMNIREVIVDYQKRHRANLGLRKRH